MGLNKTVEEVEISTVEQFKVCSREIFAAVGVGLQVTKHQDS